MSFKVLNTDVDFNKSRNVSGEKAGVDVTVNDQLMVGVGYFSTAPNKANGNMSLIVKNAGSTILQNSISGQIGKLRNQGGVYYAQNLQLFVSEGASTTLSAETVTATGSWYSLTVSAADIAAGNITIEISFSGGIEDNSSAALSMELGVNDPGYPQSILYSTMTNKVSGHMSVEIKLTA